MTESQKLTLARLTEQWQSAFTLRCNMRTLQTLVKLGLAEHRQDSLGAMFSPKTSNYYRLSKPTINKGVDK
jgi:hypothetical protein